METERSTATEERINDGGTVRERKETEKGESKRERGEERNNNIIQMLHCTKYLGETHRGGTCIGGRTISWSDCQFSLPCNYCFWTFYIFV